MSPADVISFFKHSREVVVDLFEEGVDEVVITPSVPMCRMKFLALR